MPEFMDRESELFVREICFDGEFSRYIVLVYLGCIRVEVRVDAGKMLAAVPFNPEFVFSELAENVKIEGYQVRYKQAFNVECSNPLDEMRMWFQIPIDEVYTCQVCGKQSMLVSSGWCIHCRNIYRRAKEQLQTPLERIIYGMVLEELSEESSNKFYRIIRLPGGAFYSSSTRSVWINRRHAEQAIEHVSDPENFQIVEYVCVPKLMRSIVSYHLQKKREAR